jgi:hypothetical protein
MNKPDDFWEGVAKDVSVQTRAMNESIPNWDELDDLGKKTLVLICQLAVKTTARHGRRLVQREDPVVPDDYTPGAA